MSVEDTEGGPSVPAESIPDEQVARWKRAAALVHQWRDVHCLRMLSTKFQRWATSSMEVDRRSPLTLTTQAADRGGRALPGVACAQGQRDRSGGRVTVKIIWCAFIDALCPQEIGMEGWIRGLLDEVLRPLVAILYPEVEAASLTYHYSFIVRASPTPSHPIISSPWCPSPCRSEICGRTAMTSSSGGTPLLIIAQWLWRDSFPWVEDIPRYVDEDTGEPTTRHVDDSVITFNMCLGIQHFQGKLNSRTHVRPDTHRFNAQELSCGSTATGRPRSADRTDTILSTPR